MASSFKKTEVKLELLSDIYMLLMVGKKIRGGICSVIHRYAEAYNKYLKDHVKIKNRHILNIGT